MAPRETENNAYVKFWGDEKIALWYVMVFSGVVNYWLKRGGGVVRRFCSYGTGGRFRDDF